MPSSTSTPATVDAPVDLYDLDRGGLEALVGGLGEPAYRGRQLHRWLVRGIDDPQAMTDLPSALRDRLAELVGGTRPRLERHLVVDGGATHKFLLRFADGTTIESVLMLYERARGTAARATVCVSTQAGCAMGCPFCATGQAGLQRQLTTGEIVRQVVLADAFLRGLGDERYPDHVTNVVYMGMGEPLANLGPTVASIRWLHDPDGFRLSARHVTVSTVGLVPGIDKLAALGLPLTLAVSLHAPDDELRDVLVPPNRVHPLPAVMAAVQRWTRRTGRRASFEYVLIRDVNDRVEQAERLADLVRDTRGHVNLIPLNPTPGVPEWREPERAQVERFRATLARLGVNVTVRDTRGRDADAACGQLLATYRLGEGRRLPAAVGAAGRVDLLRVAP